MKDLTLKDIIPRPEVPLTRLSVYFEGQWTFATLSTPTRSTETQSFYLISYSFGLVRQGVANPAQRALNGEAGSYAIQDRDGSLSMATPAQYEQLFPRILVDRPAPPTTSQLLQDPNYLTNVVRKSRNEGSNTIQVGNNTFNNTVSNQTIVILPSGQQRAVLASDPNDPFNVVTDPVVPDEPRTGPQAIPRPIPTTGY
tara:strand:+ start:128 stop:721 length:594 start_codon:yes stop_codon:yes gene_type:complete